MVSVYHFKSLPSTQDKAKEFSKKGISNIVVAADSQTKGRGRFRRRWHSAKDGLWMSILLKPQNISNLQYLTFIAAIAAVKSINKTANINAKIKWPNDIHYKGKKICGVLTEGIFGKENYAIVGIGINANQENFQDEIKDIAISLRMIKNKKFGIKKLLQHVLKEFFNLYNGYYRKNRFDAIQKIWKKYCDTINKEVIVTTISRKIRGTAIGIDKDCNLLLRLNSKKIIKIFEGDITIRY